MIANEILNVNRNFSEGNNSPNLFKPSYVEAREFLKFLYRNYDRKGEESFQEILNIRIVPGKKNDGQERKPLYGRNISVSLDTLESNIQAILEIHQDKNIYFGACTRKPGDGKKKGISRIYFVWLDDAPLDRVMNYPLKPSVIWETSPGRYQAAYILKEPLEHSEIHKVENILKRSALYFKSDLNATDSSRVLRVSGSWNHKYSPPPQVRVIYRSDATYELSDFDNLLPPLPKLEVDLPLSTPTLPGLSGDPELLLEEAIKEAKFHTRRSTVFPLSDRLLNAGIPYKDAWGVITIYRKRVNEVGKGEPDWHPLTLKECREVLRWVYRKGPRGPSVRQIVEWIEERERKIENLSYLFQEEEPELHETTATLFNSPCGKATVIVSSENLQSATAFKGLCHKDTCSYCSNVKKEYWKPRIYNDFARGANIAIIKPGDRGAWKKAAEREEAFGRIIYSGLTETLLFISNIRVKESFLVTWEELDELLNKYFQKEERPMNGKRKVDSFGYNKREKKEVQPEPKSEERREKKLVFFIPHDMEKLIEANTKGMAIEEKVLEIKNDDYFNKNGFNTDDVRRIFFSQETRQILKAIIARKKGKLKPTFKTDKTEGEEPNNPFEKAVFLGEW